MMNQSYFIKGFPDYRLVRLSDREFCVLSNKKGYWEEIGYKDEAGHIHLVLNGSGTKKQTSVHAIVADTFVPNPEGKPIVHHIDGDATNNDPSNLMWVTASEHKAIHNKLDNPSKKEAVRIKISKNAKLRTGEKNSFYGKHHSDETIRKMKDAKPKKAVEQWSLDGTTLIARYESIHEAARQTSINHNIISACCRNKKYNHSAGGYIWKNNITR